MKLTDVEGQLHLKGRVGVGAGSQENLGKHQQEMGPETVPPLLWQYPSSIVKYLQVVCSAQEMDMSNLPTYPPKPSSCFNLEGPENVV